MRFAICDLVLAVLVLGPATVLAQEADVELPDRVVLQQSDRSGRISIRGEILDFNGERLTIRLRTGGPSRSFAAADVVEVETPQSSAHVRGLAEFGRHHYVEAEAAFDEALRVENRRWVRRDLAAMLVRCAVRRGDYATAGTRFIELVAGDQRPRHFHLIPLVWDLERPDAALRQAAMEWNAASGDAAHLLASAALLTHPRHSAAAEATLRQLATSTHDGIRELAWAQLWRLRLQAGNIGPAELGRWEDRIETVPEALRGGPQFLLGQAYLARREYDRAATALLWLPLVYFEDHPLAAQAGLQAAEALAALGDAEGATALFRELSSRFSHTPAGQQASERLHSAGVAPDGD